MLSAKELLAPQPSKRAANGFNPTSGRTSQVVSDHKASIIAASVGKGRTSKRFQTRTFRQWLGLAVVAIAIFRNPKFVDSPKIRAAAVGLVFPGAGFIACGNILGAIAFISTVGLLFPAALFSWFAAGVFAAPIFVWVFSIIGTYFVAGEHVIVHSDIISIFLAGILVLYLRSTSAKADRDGEIKRQKRNEFLPAALQSIETTAVPAPPDAERELSLEALRSFQHVIDQSRRGLDDWTGHTIVDQFQTSALRYQMYDILYAIGTYQGIYAPNFHGYASAGARNIIEKAMTKKVMNFWKWESLWGKFTLDWDPVIRDNIMVTGFFTQGIMLYIANTGDMRYSKPQSLVFHVDDNAIYKHDIHSMDNALVSQWKSNPYCLFPCEPNWTYTPCNLQGLTGQVIYDRVFGTNHVEEILSGFRESLLADFAASSGSLIPMRSAMTGFTIPGVFGSLFDLANAIMCRGYLDDIATQMWAIFKQEVIRFDEETGEMNLIGLCPTDQMDSGTYQKSENFIYPFIAHVAAEYGDEKIRLAALKLVEERTGFETTETGATRLRSGSHTMNMAKLRAEMLRYKDWLRLIAEGPSKTALAGPILNEVPYPGVLVAKARSHTSRDLDLVLYPSASAGTFTLGIERLRPGASYTYGDKQAVADTAGKIQMTVFISGRTEVKLTPVHT